MKKEITIFAKKAQTADGRVFYKYLTRLTRKDGGEDVVEVKFTESAGAPLSNSCPCNILVDKNNVNMTNRDFVDNKTGEIRIAKRMWVSDWEVGSEYIDHSMDEYEDF